MTKCLAFQAEIEERIETQCSQTFYNCCERRSVGEKEIDVHYSVMTISYLIQNMFFYFKVNINLTRNI